MKKNLTILLFLLSLSASSQTWVGQSSNTWYVIPPTSGCDGVWALDITQWPCSGVCTYATSPFGCATSYCGPIVGDTVFLTICSVPCNIAMTCGPSSATCGTGTPPTPTAILSIDAISNFEIYPSPAHSNIAVEFNLFETKNILLEIKNILGQTLKTINSESLTKGKNKIEIDLCEFPSGLYLVQLQDEGKIITRKIIKE